MHGTTIVTGGARGIGRRIAEAVCREGGAAIVADVVEPDRDWLGRYAGRMTFIKTDVTEPDQVEALVREGHSALGPIHGFVSNAMITRPEPFLEITLDSWNQFLAVGLTGYFLCGQAVARYFVERHIAGSIVNIASVNSFAAEKHVAHYVAVKGGVAMLTKAMAVDLAEYGIRVNAVAPGMIATEKTETIFQAPEYRAQVERIPLKRPGTGEEVANLVLFLLSDGAGYITGEVYKIDGGFLSVIS